MIDQVFEFVTTIFWLVLGYLAGQRTKIKLPKQGVMRATKSAIFGAKGGVMRPEDEERAKARKKREFLAQAERNPLADIPEGLDAGDFR